MMTLSGIIMIIVFSLQIYSYNIPYYMTRMDKYEISEYTGIERTDLERICRTLADYLKGTRKDIVISANVQGISREVFNEKEKKHMTDVKNIFDLVRLLTPVSMIFFVVCSLLLSKNYGKKPFYRGLVLTGVILPVVALVPVIAALIDFNSVFTLFHKIFFTNDLWLLDPRTDILIQMLPQPFFESMAMMWGITALLLFFICIVWGTMGLRRLKRKKASKH